VLSGLKAVARSRKYGREAFPRKEGKEEAGLYIPDIIGPGN